ncbi:hypothetical protein B0H19DRAFT_1083758 [Mycena capillaripes]|nr:hypothetical protein B0H19DRAFT_1083758 [Mycena capillaripes]
MYVQPRPQSVAVHTNAIIHIDKNWFKPQQHPYSRSLNMLVPTDFEVFPVRTYGACQQQCLGVEKIGDKVLAREEEAEARPSQRDDESKAGSGPIPGSPGQNSVVERLLWGGAGRLQQKRPTNGSPNANQDPDCSQSLGEKLWTIGYTAVAEALLVLKLKSAEDGGGELGKDIASIQVFFNVTIKQSIYMHIVQSAEE